MKISINLASQPFRRDRAMIVASLAVCLLLVVSLGVLVHLAIQDNAQMGDVRHEVALLKAQIDGVTAQQAKLDAVVRQPLNETVLERSAFINALLLRKGISWNQIFHDLEKTLPYNVKLINIRPTVDDQGHVTLDTTLASETAAASQDALAAFQTNRLFGVVQIQNFFPPTQTEPLYRLAISVTYAQKL
jgi:Tfp pilus assembly protein PilN